jgi:hypothetical protein
MSCNCGGSHADAPAEPQKSHSPHHQHCSCCSCCSRCCCCCCHCHPHQASTALGSIEPHQSSGRTPGGGLGKPGDDWLPFTPVTEGGSKYTIPPTTPETGTTYQGYDATGKPTTVKAYLNGWCVIIWLVRTDPGKDGSSLAPPISSLPKPYNDKKYANLMSDPPQASVDAVAKAMRGANQLLAACKDAKIAMRVCGVIILDVRRLSWNNAGKKVTLADSFTNGVAEIQKSKPGQPSSDFFDTLQQILSNGGADGETLPNGQTVQGDKVFTNFAAKLKKPCFHISFV